MTRPQNRPLFDFLISSLQAAKLLEAGGAALGLGRGAGHDGFPLVNTNLQSVETGSKIDPQVEPQLPLPIASARAGLEDSEPHPLPGEDAGTLPKQQLGGGGATDGGGSDFGDPQLPRAVNSQEQNDVAMLAMQGDDLGDEDDGTFLGEEGGEGAAGRFLGGFYCSCIASGPWVLEFVVLGCIVGPMRSL